MDLQRRPAFHVSSEREKGLYEWFDLGREYGGVDAGDVCALGIADGEEWELFAGLDVPLEELRQFIGASAFAAKPSLNVARAAKTGNVIFALVE